MVVFGLTAGQHTKEEERPLRYVSKRRYLAHLHWRKMSSLGEKGQPKPEEEFELQLPIKTRPKTTKKRPWELNSGGDGNSPESKKINSKGAGNDGCHGDNQSDTAVGQDYDPCNSEKYEIKKEDDETEEEDPWEMNTKEESVAFWGESELDEKEKKDTKKKEKKSDGWSSNTVDESEAFWTSACEVGTSKNTSESNNMSCASGSRQDSVSSSHLVDTDKLETLDTKGVLDQDMSIGSDQNVLPSLQDSQTEYKNAMETSTAENPMMENSTAEISTVKNSTTETARVDNSTAKMEISKKKSAIERELDPRCISSHEDGDLYVVDDSEDSEAEDSVMATRLKWMPSIKRDPAKIHECLQLSLEEAFFLSYGLGCLVILDTNKKPLDLLELWQTFCDLQPSFLQNYIAYHHFRSKGWVPKPGLKYGAEFMVYKEGPPFYHASYSVLVRLATGDLHDDVPSNRSLTWQSLSGMNRVTETVNKEVMICYVVPPKTVSPQDLQSPNCISRFSVQEVVMKRWISKQERENAEYIIMP